MFLFVKGEKVHELSIVPARDSLPRGHGDQVVPCQAVSQKDRGFLMFKASNVSSSNHKIMAGTGANQPIRLCRPGVSIYK